MLEKQHFGEEKTVTLSESELQSMLAEQRLLQVSRLCGRTKG